MNFANLRIRTRLAAGFGVIAAMLILIVGLSITMLGRVNQGADGIITISLPTLHAAANVLNEADKIAIRMNGALLTDDKADRDALIADAMRARKVIVDVYDAFRGKIEDEKGATIFKEADLTTTKLVKAQDELLRRINGGDMEGARAYLNTEFRPLSVYYAKVLNSQMDRQKEIAVEAAAAAAKTYRDTRLLILGLGIVAFAFAVAIGYWLTASITRPVTQALQVADTVASGDLTTRIEVSRGDELGQLLAALKRMQDSLSGTVSGVRQNADSVANASSQILQGNNDLSSRTEEQASSLQQTAASMAQLTGTVKQNADNARQANQLAVNASEIATRGGEVVTRVVETMEAIDTSSRKVVDIIAVIDGIAFQTNILALNAAVEAARAGDQGRGFAVVAAEVRNLAQRSAAAAKEIKALIDDSVGKVGEGSQLVTEAGQTMGEIVESVKRVTDIMAEISAASQEQTTGIQQVSQAITQMDQVTQQNAALVEEAAAAAASLQEQARNLSVAVGTFKLDEAKKISPAPLPKLAAALEPAPAPRLAAAGAGWSGF